MSETANLYNTQPPCILCSLESSLGTYRELHTWLILVAMYCAAATRQYTCTVYCTTRCTSEACQMLIAREQADYQELILTGL